MVALVAFLVAHARLLVAPACPMFHLAMLVHLSVVACAWHLVAPACVVFSPRLLDRAKAALHPTLHSARSIGPRRHATPPVSAHSRYLLAPLICLTALGFLTKTSATRDHSLPLVYSLSHVRRPRALQTVVSDVTSLTRAIGDASVSHIVVAAGHYMLTARLEVDRSLTLEADVPGSVVLDAQGSTSPVIGIFIAATDTVQLTGLNITGGYSYDFFTSLQGMGISIGPRMVNQCGPTAEPVHLEPNRDGTSPRCFAPGAEGGHVTLTSIAVYNNTFGISGAAGGVLVYLSTVTFQSCNIHNNQATYAGGIWVLHSSVSFVDTEIHSNKATGPPSMNYAAGVYIDAEGEFPPMLIGAKGKHIWQCDGCTANTNVDFVRSNIYQNEAKTSQPVPLSGYVTQGGGILVRASNCACVLVQFTACNIYNNEATSGPNLYIDTGNGANATVCAFRTTLTNFSICNDHNLWSGLCTSRSETLASCDVPTPTPPPLPPSPPPLPPSPPLLPPPPLPPPPPLSPPSSPSVPSSAASSFPTYIALTSAGVMAVLLVGIGIYLMLRRHARALFIEGLREW